MCCIDKLIKLTNEKVAREETDSISCSAELSGTEAGDVLNLDGCDDKVD